MAHPLTQYPPPSLPFPTAPRPSPLAFGFGLPTSPSPLSFNTPPRPTFPSAPSSSFGFGQHASPTSTPLAGPSVHSPRKPPIRPGISPSTSFRTSTTSLKRTRKSPSPTPSSSPSPTSSNLVSPCIGNLDLPRKEKDDPLSVVNLDLGNDGGKKRKEIKRLRKDVEDKGKQNSPSDIDVGVLLAALPSSAHLPILLNILSANPQLAAGVMTNLPKPDHNECLAQLVKHVDAVKRAAGNSAIQLNASRLWGRVEKDVQAFTKTASTYLTFFTSPSDGAPIDPQSIQHLLQGISTHVIYLLRLVPPGSDPNLATIQLLLQLGKRVISAWMKWLDFVSEEVNQRNEMYPHSIVEGWSYNLECLSDADKNINSFTWNQVENTQNDLVNSFKDAMRPIRARFMNELGWLIGRRNTGGANLFALSGGGMSWNDLHSNNSVNQKEDEEL